MGKKLHPLLTLPIVALALPLMSAPAQAATGYDRCHEGYYCLFSGLDGTGDIVELNTNVPDLAVYGMADRAKSDWNRTDSVIHLYSEANWGGCTAATGPRGKGNFYSTYRDFFNGVRIGGPNGPSCGISDEFRVKSHL
ncbi:peptidase inhibitor family I36 protein [Nonomuraea bangladeshensis]|jgi:hypothetical protein|uniref:Peptidase inhibitor family I36 protein n=1 Tax=Nonomuraea bangladeshensis TaxID=404385 RepID=A0ABV3HG74_9ACTN